MAIPPPPAPMLMRQRKRYFQQIEYNETIQRMLYEVNTAKEKEAERLADMKEQKQQIIANKLKPKGIALNAGSLRFNKKRHVYSAPAFS
ncbi:39S ribosomal protein L52 [Tropilaelaps mercedesae]|uniref:39S ribosomal protein L52 n=1 Tax=Tropilaelaps mercedesae TaxID=418985 RepID=A0A1V9WZW2_9ACAR|nr:39S ribosomal protein L52 [Tropilaelaps mercedesae]